jgi:hypothetical protein
VLQPSPLKESRPEIRVGILRGEEKVIVGDLRHPMVLKNRFNSASGV